MKERNWITLVANVRHGETVLVLGSEVQDTGTHLEALQLRLAAELEEDGKPSSGNSLAAVSQLYEDSFGSSALRASAETFYATVPAAHSDVYAALAALPVNLILTSRQDDALLQYLRAAGKEPTAQRYHLRGEPRDNPEFLLPTIPEAPVVYHLFGHMRDPASLVLSENDILDFMIAVASKKPPLPNSLVRALQRKGQSFLFVGFGIGQWYLRLLLKVLIRVLDLNHTSNPIAAEALNALPAGDREQTVLLLQRSPKIEVVDGDVSAFVAELSRRISAAGGYAGRSDGVPRPRVFISYASEDAGLAAKVCEVLRAANFDPWLDQEELRGGELWDRSIEEGLAASEYALVLHTPALGLKTDSYVNKEIRLAEERALRVRSPFRFLFPVRSDDLAEEDRVPALAKYQEIVVRRESLAEDLGKVVSEMRRDYQRRNR